MAHRKIVPRAIFVFAHPTAIELGVYNLKKLLVSIGQKCYIQTANWPSPASKRTIYDTSNGEYHVALVTIRVEIFIKSMLHSTLENKVCFCASSILLTINDSKDLTNN